MSTNRWFITDDSNGVSPTGFTSPFDSSVMLRKCSDHLARIANGGANGKIQIALNPVAALATVTATTSGNESASDTITVGGIAITFETSGAAGASKQVNIAAGTAGTSTSGASPALTATGLLLSVNINSDGPQIISVDDAGTHTGAQVAAKIQTAIRALTPINALNAVAFSAATCAYGSTYAITSGVKGVTSSVVVASVPGNLGAANLKLGIYNGGTEAIGTFSSYDAVAALINGQTLAGAFTGSSTAFAGICTAFVCGKVLTLTAAIPGTIGNGLALAVSSANLTITNAWGAATAGTEGTATTYSLGL